MKAVHFALSCLIFAATTPAVASSGIVDATCNDRALGTTAECVCLQTLANDTVRIGLHDLIAEYLGRQIDVAAIAAERGHSGAEQLASEAYLFRRDAVKMCGVDLPES